MFLLSFRGAVMSMSRAATAIAGAVRASQSRASAACLLAKAAAPSLAPAVAVESLVVSSRMATTAAPVVDMKALRAKFAADIGTPARPHASRGEYSRSGSSLTENMCSYSDLTHERVCISPSFPHLQPRPPKLCKRIDSLRGCPHRRVRPRREAPRPPGSSLSLIASRMSR